MPTPRLRILRPAARALLSAALLALAACGSAEDSARAPSSDQGGAVWGADYFPNTTLTTHKGERVQFFDDLVKDKVVAINFIYTSCPDACPMETERLLEVQRLLADRMGEDVHFYSISIDPEHDTPEVLAAYVEQWKIGPGWTFLHGSRDEVRALQQKLGVYNGELEDIVGRKQDHKLTLVIGNQRSGRWMKRSPYENPYVLANQLGSWLHNWKLPAAEVRDYADAPAVRTVGAGENLFRTRCSSCHTLGGGAGEKPGPDLYNIHRQRDHAWLRQWMIAPDAMVAAGDPLAVQLVADHGGVVMPNLRLTDVDVDNVMGFLAEESARIDAEIAARAPEPAPVTPPTPPAGGEGKAPCH